ncbi:endoplasmic reticulum mannosyl-oligosaccharide 1,2-alpha-mannosidase [Purpureocillium lavendulum]|uniref:Endoplasmic reticulum mannosyl-oligosaccharide 1,2-alpha-mannosidase n=1 Tax=Purpureocillium lavendulum TaxID=1247861 RepID=A0AB34FNR6_9HYPO|nr:endoplasmic reticulum mannosyl-oligosaccharide 1,2-alpha-mannosidase [Purpureocillium lavendulum]
MRFPNIALLATAASAASLSISLKRSAGLDVDSVTKRDVISLTADNNVTGGGYYAEVEVGTPGQKVKVHLDTGSSDTWVNTVDTDLCSDGRYTGCKEFFNPNKSSTFKTVAQNAFNLSYLDQRSVRGDYFNDTIRINGKDVKQQRLGLPRNMIPGSGVMGLGLSSGVAADQTYPAIVDHMAAEGVIGRAAFSLYLNHSSASSGVVIFGGIDTRKYIGNLATLPLVAGSKPGSGVQAYAVRMSGVTITDSDDDKQDKKRANDLNVTVVLDSGSTLTFLPDEYVEPIWKKFDVERFQNKAFIDCKHATSSDDVSLKVAFPNKTITVPISELVVDFPQKDLLKILGLKLDDPCIFGIQGTSFNNITGNSFGIIGDTVLRSAYVLYDAANKQVGIAQANVASTESNIVDLEAGETTIPDVSGVDGDDANERPSPTSGAPEPSQTQDDESAAKGNSPTMFLIYSTMFALLAITL